jgi:Tol biopolymer transport system component
LGNRELIFSSDRSGRRELWRAPAAGGPSVRLDGVGEDALDVAVSQNGGTLIYNHGHATGSLWKIPISGGKGGEPVRVTDTTARDKFSQFSPDGKRIAFESGRSGVDEIWTCDADGTDALQLTSFGRGVSGSPRWSPDGRMIAFDSNVGGNFGIYAIRSEGGKPVPLTKNGSTNAVPAWSRDGQWIYFTSWRTGRAEVWKIRANGESETQVTREGGGLATESADRQYLYFVRGGEDLGDLFRMPIRGGDAIKVLSGMKGRLFTVFAKGVYFAAGSSQVELRYLEFATNSIHVIGALPGLPHADISADERWALYPQPAFRDTNLLVASNFR